MVAFPGNQFNGDIAPEIDRLMASGLVRVLDLVFVAKDEQGDTITLEFDQLDELAAFGDLEGEVGGLVNMEDLDHVAANLPEGNSALVIVWEDVWARPLVEAVRARAAWSSTRRRSPRALVEAALDELAAGARELRPQDGSNETDRTRQRKRSTPCH